MSPDKSLPSIAFVDLLDEKPTEIEKDLHENNLL